MRRESNKSSIARRLPFEPFAIGITAVREETRCEIFETFLWQTTPTFERAIPIDARHNESKGAAIALLEIQDCCFPIWAHMCIPAFGS
jgi:hypothetical protein